MEIRDIYSIYISSLHGSVVRCINTDDPTNHIVTESCDVNETTYDTRTIHELNNLLEKSNFTELPYTLFTPNSGKILINKRYSARYDPKTFNNIHYHTLSCLIKLKLNDFPVIVERIGDSDSVELSISLRKILEHITTIENYSELTIIIFDRTCNPEYGERLLYPNAMGGKSNKKIRKPEGRRYAMGCKTNKKIRKPEGRRYAMGCKTNKKIRKPTISRTLAFRKKRVTKKTFAQK